MNNAETKMQNFLEMSFKEDMWSGMASEIEVSKAKIRVQFELESGMKDPGEFFGAVVHAGKNGVNLLADFEPEWLAHMLSQYLPDVACSSKKIIPRGLEFWPC